MGPMGPAGFRRRGRRRGLIVGAAVGAAAGRASARRGQQDDADTAAPVDDTASQLKQAQSLKDQGLINDDEFQAKRKQILGI